MATLQSSKTKALNKAYSTILDNLEDAEDLTFTMIQQACVRKLRARTDRGDDRHPERRPATPHRGSYSGPSKDKAPRHSRSKSFSRPGDAGDVSAFLVNFLANHGVKATKVLKDADLDPTDVRSGFALRALLEEADKYIPPTIDTDTDSDGTDCRSDSQASSASADDYVSFLSLYVYCGKRTGIVFLIFLSLYVFLRFLTWRDRHSQPLFATRRFCFVISEPLQD